MEDIWAGNEEFESARKTVKISDKRIFQEEFANKITGNILKDSQKLNWWHDSQIEWTSIKLFEALNYNTAH